MLKWNVFIVLSIIICTCSSDNIGDYEDPAVCRLVQNGSEIEKIEVGKDRQNRIAHIVCIIFLESDM